MALNKGDGGLMADLCSYISVVLETFKNPQGSD